MAPRVALLAADLQIVALEAHPPRVLEAEQPRHDALVHQLLLAEQLAVRRPVASRRDHEPRRHLDPPAHFDGARRRLVVRADEDVREHVVAADDPAQRLAQHGRLVEDVLEELGVVPLRVHQGSLQSLERPQLRQRILHFCSSIRAPHRSQ